MDNLNVSAMDPLSWPVSPLLILVVAVIAVFTYLGYRRGLIKLAVSLVTLVLGFYLVSLAVPYVSDYLKNETDIYELLTERINESFREANGARDNTIYENQLETIDSYRLPSVVKSVLVKENVQEVYERLAAHIFEEYVSKYLADLILRALSFLFSYALVMLLMKITVLSAEFVSKLPVISGINRTAGAVFGLLEGTFFVLVSFTAATFLMGREFYEMVSRSRILTYIYDNNALLKFFI